MNIHKSTKLTPVQREQIWKEFQQGIKVKILVEKYSVSKVTIYKIIRRARKKEFIPRKSINKKYRCLEYGLKRLAKIEKQIEEKLKRKAKRYNKKYPGEMLHFDTKRLPIIEGQKTTDKREYLFVAIDDFSRELFAAILPNKTQDSSSKFLEQVIEECPYTIEIAYSDNGTEYKGTIDHKFVELCKSQNIEQRFTKIKTPRTNGKAERVIRTIMEMWHQKTKFKNLEHRKKELNRFINYYNTVKPHKGIDNLTPHEKLLEYFYPENL